MPSFQPGNGYLSAVSTIDGRTIVYAILFSRDFTNSSARVFVYVYTFGRLMRSARVLPSLINSSRSAIVRRPFAVLSIIRSETSSRPMRRSSLRASSR